MKESPFLEIKPDFLRIYPYEIKPLPDFQIKKNFPYCCESHKKAIQEITFHFVKYIQNDHTFNEYQKKGLIKVEEYKNWPIKILKLIEYTIHFMEKRIDNDDWLEDITNYFEYCSNSLGQPTFGFHIYGDYILHNIEMASFIPNEKKEPLKCWFPRIGYPESEEVTIDINKLFSIYQKWLDAFPFDISFFNELKAHFENQLPFLSEEPKFNPYTGFAKSKVHTEESLINYLITLTNAIFTHVNGVNLYEKGLVNDFDKVQIEIINQERKIEIKELKYNSKDEQNQFIQISKKWLKGERKYFERIRKIVDVPYLQIEEAPPKNLILSNSLSKYQFFELEKVKILKEESRKELIKIIAKNSAPYQIAMYDFLDFIKHLKETHFNSDVKLFRFFEKELKIKERTAKGNIYTLNPYSKEKKTRYTAYQHKEQVIKDYNSLK